MDTIEESGPRPRRLPVRQLPYPDEATTGYLCRLADSNGFFGLRELLRYVVELGEGDCKYGLTLATCLPREVIEGLVGPYPSYWATCGNLAGLAIQDFNQQVLRWCPLCLDESDHLRGQWLLKICTVCTRHSVYLHDHCPCCGQPQRLERPTVSTCYCGGRLTAAGITPASAPVKRLTQAIEDAIAGLAPTEGLPPLRASEWIRLAKYLGQFSESFHPRRPGQVANLHQLEFATTLMHGLSHLLDDWPTNFHAVLASIHRTQQATPSLRRAFSPIYRVLYGELNAPCFQFLRDAFEYYLHENWWGLVCKRNRSLQPQTIENHPRLTFKDAARQAGTSPAMVRHLAQGELIESMESPLPSGRRSRSIHQREVERLALIALGMLTLTDVAQLLQLPERRIRELVSAGIVIPSVSKSSTGSAAWGFSRESVYSLSAIEGRASPDAVAVSIKRILRTWRLRSNEFVALVEAVMSDQLCSTSSMPIPFGASSLAEEETREWLRNFRLNTDGWLSVDAAARILELKQQVAYELVAKGLLPSFSTTSSVRQISISDLRAFQSSYVSLAELARNQRRSPRWLLKEIGAVPVSGPAVDGSRQYFFRRADILAQQRPPIGGLGMVSTHEYNQGA